MGKVKKDEDVKISLALQHIADSIQRQLKGIGVHDRAFALVVFNSKPGGRMQYVANGDRRDVAQALKALLDGWGDGMPDVPAHKIS